MNTKTIILTLMLCGLLIGLAGIRLSKQVGDTDSSTGERTNADNTVEVTWSFEVRIRLPILRKDAI